MAKLAGGGFEDLAQGEAVIAGDGGFEERHDEMMIHGSQQVRLRGPVNEDDDGAFVVGVVGGQQVADDGGGDEAEAFAGGFDLAAKAGTADHGNASAK